MIQERLSALREEMKKWKIDIYIVPTADFHESEYVGEHFKPESLSPVLPDRQAQRSLP